MKNFNVNDSNAGGRTRRAVKYGVFLALAVPVFFAVPATVMGGSQATQPQAQATPTAAGKQAQPSGAAPYVNQQYGFVMALLGNNPLVRSMGFQWVQYGAYWKDAEPNPGQYDWGNVDNIIRSASANGLKLLMRVSRTPAWARDPACAGNDTCPPADPNTFGSFMYALAAHVRNSGYRPPAIAYEIWNEPNTDLEWGGLCPDPARYAGLLRAAYPQVKSADSGATVVGGAVTTVGERFLPGTCHMDDLDFLDGMYNAGAAPYFDVLSDHPYGFAYAPEADPVNGTTRLVFRRAESHHQLMVNHGDGAKQIWATEMGWALDPATIGSPCPRPDWYYIFSPQQQADYLVRALQWARSYWPWMGNMFIWNFDFSEASWYGPCDPFRFWSVKDQPAQSALSSFVHNPPPTYTPAVDNPPVVNAVRYSQTSFNRYGGTLTVEVDASDNDNSPVSTVQAILHYPDGSSQLIPFTLVSGTTRLGTWRSSPISIAANTQGTYQYYTVSPQVIETSPPGRTTNGPDQQIAVTNTRFWDVPTDFWAYQYIEYLANQGAIGGYSDGSFRPNNSTTRGQLSKIVVLGFNMPLQNPPTNHFADVPPGSTFYQYVETAYAAGLIGGYPCGGVGEPCDPQNRPYFRPNNPVTRGQIAKIVVLAAGWQPVYPASNTFADVPSSNTFYGYIESAFAHGIVGGYNCGGPGEPCDPQNRPYFRWGNNATRAQISKMVYLAITAGTPTPVPTTTPPSNPTATVTVAAGGKP